MLSIGNGYGAQTVGISALALAMLFGCTASRQEPRTPPPPSAVPVETPSAPVAAASVPTLLEAARLALAEDRLTTPSDDCAYGYYRQILDVSPAHPAATAGFERIVERYIALARRAIERERWVAARTLLERAGFVDSAHPGIEPLRRQVDLLAAARRLALVLEQPALRQRRGGLAQRLAAFGAEARRANARVTIRAGNDADGRWIYQQLNRAPGQRRIRADLDIGLPPQVTILLLPSAGGA